VKQPRIPVNAEPHKSRTVLIVLIILIVLIGAPLTILQYQAKKTGKTLSQLIDSIKPSHETTAFNSGIMGEKIDFLQARSIGFSFESPPQISHLQVVDLDKDGLLDIVVCDVLENTINWIRQDSLGIFNERILADNIMAPSHINVADIDGDGDLDLMVGLLGMLFPSNDKIGSIVVLENDGNTQYTPHKIIQNIARVSDVRAGDLDGDGDMDLAAIQFGYDDGETRWLENLGDWKFESHILQTLSGGINCELIDIDKDNDLDIITIVSQEWEETYLFVNDGAGNFQSKLIYGVSNDDFGSSGISLSDFDQDGDMDVLYTNGDAFDYIPPRPRPWHGVNWLENKGNYQFEFHRIGNFGGAYNARPLDIDSDGDLDIFVVSSFNLWDQLTAQSFIWFENSGDMTFIRHNIANNPTHILSLEMGDFNADGKMDFVTGGMHVYPPYDRMNRITLWENHGK